MRRKRGAKDRAISFLILLRASSRATLLLLRASVVNLLFFFPRLP
jgi:hypothetical protein